MTQEQAHRIGTAYGISPADASCDAFSRARITLSLPPRYTVDRRANANHVDTSLRILKNPDAFDPQAVLTAHAILAVFHTLKASGAVKDEQLAPVPERRFGAHHLASPTT